MENIKVGWLAEMETELLGGVGAGQGSSSASLAVAGRAGPPAGRLPQEPAGSPITRRAGLEPTVRPAP